MEKKEIKLKKSQGYRESFLTPDQRQKLIMEKLGRAQQYYLAKNRRERQLNLSR